jgi:hypothetical protein
LPLRLVMVVVLVSGIFILGTLTFIALQKTNAEAIASASFDFPANSTTTIHVKQGSTVLLGSYEQLYPPWMIEVFLGIFWAYTTASLLLIGLLLLRTRAPEVHPE